MNNKELWALLALGLTLALIIGCSTDAKFDRRGEKIFIVDPKPFRKLTGIIVPKPYDPTGNPCVKHEYYAYVPVKDTYIWVCEESIVFLD